MSSSSRAAVKVLVISGSMGSGKTTVLGEASDLLTAADIPHAALDVDALGLAHVPAGAAADDVAARNLISVWRNYTAAGIDRLLVAEAIDTVAKREQVEQLAAGGEIVICRLHARLDTMRERVRIREPGMRQREFVTRVAELETSLAAAALEDFIVDNDGRSVTDVARELLLRAGWLSP